MEKLAVKYDHPVGCLGCYRTTLFNTELPIGWIAEAWPTLGDTRKLTIILCFRCRRLTIPYDGDSWEHFTPESLPHLTVHTAGTGVIEGQDQL